MLSTALKSVPAPANPLATVDIMTLLDDHDRIDDLAEQIALLSCGPVSAAGETLEVLATLATLVTEHLRVEDIAIYPMLHDLLPDPHLRDASDAIANFEGLRADWGDFLGEWTPDCVVADWGGFREAAHDMLVRLRARVHWETSLIYPFALRRCLIRLRPAS